MSDPYPRLTPEEVAAVAKDYEERQRRRLTPEQIGIPAADVKDINYNWWQNVVEYFPVPGRNGVSEPYVFAQLPEGWNIRMSVYEIHDFLQRREDDLAAEKRRSPRRVQRCTPPSKFHEDCLTEVWFDQ